ncbi:MAG: glycosyltransferase family 39 protein, partial [Candidatus Saccharibacteria bacterium]|nr:glycosyltransferase family 39 protein [Candidatus Saccharibacteria bacterium]
MARLKLTDFFTYRYRYQIGYFLIIVTFIALLVVAGLFVPDGFSSSETKDFVQTAAMDLQSNETLAIPNMPFFAAQRLSIDLFGSSTFAFKLPALICAFFTGIGAVLLLRRWFRPNIAVLGTVIMITTGQF